MNKSENNIHIDEIEEQIADVQKVLDDDFFDIVWQEDYKLKIEKNY